MRKSFLSQHLLSVLQITVLCAFGVYVFGFFQQSIAIVQSPWAVDYVEVPELNRALQLAQGKEIYRSWDGPPFWESNYTPIFSWLHSFCIDLVQPSFFWGRSFNVLLSLLTASLLIRIVHSCSVPLWKALLAGFLYVSTDVIWLWGSLLRVDTLAVFFNIMALWVFCEPKAKSWKGRNLGIAVLCILAAFTRQTMIASMASILLVLAFENRKAFVQVLGMYIGLGMVGVAWLMSSTKGLAYQHLVVANVNSFSWENVAFFFGNLWTLYHGWLIPILVGLVYVFRKKRSLFWYAVFSLLVALTIGKIGASLNYIMELMAISSVLCVLGLAKADEKWLGHWRWGSVGLWLLMLISWQQLLHIPWSRAPKAQGGFTAQADTGWDVVANGIASLPFGYLDPFGEQQGKKLLSRSVRLFPPHPGVWELAGIRNIEENLPKFPGLILSEDMNATITDGRPLWIQPFEFNQMAEQGIWDPQPLHTAIANKDFALVLLLFSLDKDISGTASGQRFSKKTQRLLQENYDFITREGNYWIYRPKMQP